MGHSLLARTHSKTRRAGQNVLKGSHRRLSQLMRAQGRRPSWAIWWGTYRYYTANRSVNCTTHRICGLQACNLADSGHDRDRRGRLYLGQMNTSTQPQTGASFSWRGLLVALALVCVWRTGLAALGAAPANPANATASVTAAYRTIENLLDNGTRVQEFVTPAGVVFAVTWRGPVLPDLRALLGDYLSLFQQHTEATRQAGMRGGPVNLVQERLVLRSSGRMGQFSGYAYVPSLVPAGVNINDVLG